MFTCEHCQENLLPFLYDLLSREEHNQVKDHLEACAACQAALEKARTHQSLLAEAFKQEFADVRFVPPAADTPRRLVEPTQVASKYQSAGHAWGRWAMAASVLLAVLTTGYTIFGWTGRSQQVLLAKNNLAKTVEDARLNEVNFQERQRRNQDDIRAIQEQIGRLVGDWQQETQKAQQRTLEGDKGRVQIRGPKSVQAGAGNEFFIQVAPPSKGGVETLTPAKPADVVARVVEAKSKKVLVEKQVDAKGAFRFDLPRDLAVKPGDQLALEIEAKGPEGFQVRESLNLVAPEYLTHLTTDRPMYRPGETVRYRSLTLERFSLRPPAEDLQLRFVITAPNGGEIHKAEGKSILTLGEGQDPIKGPDGQPLRGIGAGEFTLPADLKGGPYVLTLSERKDRFPSEKRTFLVNVWQTPKLNKELHFTKSSYGPGERVDILAQATRVEGGPAANNQVTMSAQVDGRVVANLILATDGQGKLKAGFNLPAAENMPAGDGFVSLEFHDGGVETLVKPIPIVLKKLRVDFYPEGGDLIAGVPNRVYFQVKTTLDKPAELQGRLVDADGKEVTKVQTFAVEGQPQLNQGMGAFEFTPQAGKQYELKMDRPFGMEGRYLLPTVRADGVALNIPQGVIDQKIDLILHSSGKDRELLVGAYCRGRLLDSGAVTAKSGQAAKFSLKTTPGVSGVYRVTVFEKVDAGAAHQYVPRAERLVYRPADKKLNLTLKADKSSYTPGSSANVEIQATNEKNGPAPAVMLVYAVDLSVLKLADDKTIRSMPTHFLLTREVQKPEDLENADFLLGDHTQAPVALDLLLGTQGWRRFAEQDPALFQKRQPAEAPRVLLAMAQPIQNLANPLKEQIDKVDEKFAPQFVDLQQKLAQTEKQDEAVAVQGVEERQRLLVEQSRIQTELARAEDDLRYYRTVVSFVSIAAIVLALLIAGVVLLVIGLRRQSMNRSGVGFIVTGASFLAAILVGGLAAVAFMFLAVGHRDVAAPMAAKVADAPAEARMEAKDFAPPPDGKLKLDAAPAPPMAPMMKEAGPMPMPAPAGVKMAMPGIGKKADRPKLAPPVAKILADQDMRPEQIAGGARPFQQGMPGALGRPGFGGMAPPEGVFANLDMAFGQDERQLRRERKFQELLMQRLHRPVPAIIGQEPFLLREYAHRSQPKDPDAARSDFTETLYWHPALVVADGKANVSFAVSDSITRFQVVAVGHTLDGRLGQGSIEIVSKLPFTVDPKTPVEVTGSDKITLPVSIVNDTQQDALVRLGMKSNLLRPLSPADVDVSLTAGQRKVHYFKMQADAVGQPLSAAVNLSGMAAGLSDRIERSFTVVPDGFPIARSVSGLLENSASHEIDLPAKWEDIVNGTLQVKVSAYPSTLAELQKGLESMLREPCGCFEQSSSSNYPNVLILNYMQDTKQANPQLEERTRQLLKSGYQQLTSFECMDPRERVKKEGYEWFGQTAPPHEALTAYGLLQFRDMARVFDVNKDMVERTRKYLLAQRDGKGGFKRNPRALDTFGRAPEHVTSAYILWALTDSKGEKGEGADLDKEIAQLLKQVKEPNLRDPYFYALSGLSFLNAGKTQEAIDLLKDLRKFQKDDGKIDGAKTSITASGERDLAIETTALTLLAWLKANRPEEFNPNVQKAATWLGQQRSGFGGFGGTQSTILALKALIAFTKDNQKTVQAGEMRLFVNDQKEPAAIKAFGAGMSDTIELALPIENHGLKVGKNKLRLEVTGNTTFPYTLAWNYNAVKPANPDQCPVHLTTNLDKTDVKEGETVRLTTVVENKSGKGQGMAVAILGLPGGLSLPEDMTQLKNLAQLREDGTKPGVISFWELKGRELVLYWRDLAPDAKITVNLDLICRIPGEYRGPASRAYLYYNGDRRYFVDPLAIAIAPQE